MTKGRMGMDWLRDGVFPFVLGLFVTVATVDQLGVLSTSSA